MICFCLQKSIITNTFDNVQSYRRNKRFANLHGKIKVPHDYCNKFDLTQCKAFGQVV